MISKNEESLEREKNGQPRDMEGKPRNTYPEREVILLLPLDDASTKRGGTVDHEIEIIDADFVCVDYGGDSDTVGEDSKYWQRQRALRNRALRKRITQRIGDGIRWLPCLAFRRLRSVLWRR